MKIATIKNERRKEVTERGWRAVGCREETLRGRGTEAKFKRATSR